jgi:hypothetical protein
MGLHTVSISHRTDIRLSEWVIIALIGGLLLITPVSAYQIILQAPSSVVVGEPLPVTGTTTLPVGTTFFVVFSRSNQMTEEIAKRSVTVQDDKNFGVVFETGGLEGGIYKIEVPKIPDYQLLGDSVTTRVVELIDRSSELEMRSPLTQEFNGILWISGTLKGSKNTGMKVTVMTDGTNIFGPEYIATNKDGVFSKEVPIVSPGSYYVSFADTISFIAMVPMTVTSSSPTTQPTPSGFQTTSPTTSAPTITATADASRDRPAYFAVTSLGGPLTLRTPSGIDWVIEYADESGGRQKVNNEGSTGAEQVTIPQVAGTLYVKVYPYKFQDNGTVTLSGENAGTIQVMGSPPPVFADQTPTTTPPPTTKSPLPGVIPMSAIGIFIIIMFAPYRR